MTQNLKNLGASLPFTPAADFSGIRNGLYISKVHHQAVVEVNEEGTEAAAATDAHMFHYSWIRTNMFICNRPFLFVIHDNANGGILFIGKYINPSKNIKTPIDFKFILICLGFIVYFIVYSKRIIKRNFFTMFEKLKNLKGFYGKSKS